MALGRHNQNYWPPFPEIPVYPTGLCQLDQNRFRARVHAELKRSTAGKLL